jgi:hypothetical protein
MITLKRPVRRITQCLHHGRQLVVSLEPSDLISIRQKGRRTAYVMPISAVYDLGAKIYARELIRLKAQLKKERKAGRT